jgi:hypothetical protein
MYFYGNLNISMIGGSQNLEHMLCPYLESFDIALICYCSSFLMKFNSLGNSLSLARLDVFSLMFFMFS